MKFFFSFLDFKAVCRLPYGRRGLKWDYTATTDTAPTDGSSPVWEAWIEITANTSACCPQLCRLPYGRRGLKFISCLVIAYKLCRLPYGRRGLKSRLKKLLLNFLNVVSRMGGVD